MNTEKILFICGGAFVGLKEIISERLGRKILGFTSDDRAEVHQEQTLLAHCQPEDLLSFGLIPEFIGRLPVLSTLHHLDAKDLVKILTLPKNSLVKQYQKLLHLEGIELHITPGALHALSQEAVKRGTGARALRALFEKVMLDVMYTVPGRTDIAKVTITRKAIEGKTAAHFHKKKNPPSQREAA